MGLVLFDFWFALGKSFEKKSSRPTPAVRRAVSIFLGFLASMSKNMLIGVCNPVVSPARNKIIIIAHALDLGFVRGVQGRPGTSRRAPRPSGRLTRAGGTRSPACGPCRCRTVSPTPPPPPPPPPRARRDTTTTLRTSRRSGAGGSALWSRCDNFDIILELSSAFYFYLGLKQYAHCAVWHTLRSVHALFFPPTPHCHAYVYVQRVDGEGGREGGGGGG